MSGIDAATVIAGAGLALSATSAVAGVAGAGAGAAGAGIKAQGQILQGKLQANQDLLQANQADYQAETQQYEGGVADYQAQVAKNNAEIARMAGARVVQAGEVKADTTSLATAGKVSKIKANQAANGIDVNTGSAVDVRADATASGHADAETALSDAKLANWGYRTQAGTYEEQAGLDVAQGVLNRGNAGNYTNIADYYRQEASFAPEAAGLGAEGTQIGGVASLLNTASSLPLKFSGFGGDTATPAEADAFSTAVGTAGINAATSGFELPSIPTS